MYNYNTLLNNADIISTLTVTCGKLFFICFNIIKRTTPSIYIVNDNDDMMTSILVVDRNTTQICIPKS
jgi:hypothetical protein